MLLYLCIIKGNKKSSLKDCKKQKYIGELIQKLCRINISKLSDEWDKDCNPLFNQNIVALTWLRFLKISNST